MLRILLILLVALVVYALVDCVRYNRTQMPGGLPKALWVTLIIVFPAAGALAWLVVSRVNTQAQRAARSGRAHPSGYAPGVPPRRPVTRPVAPDDDPEFLASLNRRAEQERREAEAEQAEEGEQDTEDGATDGADDDGGPGTRH